MCATMPSQLPSLIRKMDWSSGFGWGNRMGSQVQWDPQAGMGEGGGGGEEQQAWVRDGS